MNRVCSIFAQMLQFFPRLEFESCVREHQAERHARGFNSWSQFVAMLFAQLGQAQSLREIMGGLTETASNNFRATQFALGPTFAPVPIEDISAKSRVPQRIRATRAQPRLTSHASVG